jgi:methionyl-tRNA synthetase
MRKCKVCGEIKELSEFPRKKHSGKYYIGHDCKVCFKKKKSAQQKIWAQKRKAAEPKRRCEECGKVKRAGLFHSPQATVCNRCVSRLKVETGFFYTKNYSYILSTISEHKKKPLRLLTIRRSA